jgi:carboxynorspermidine decarboxylase
LLQTPYYLIDKSKLLVNMEKIARCANSPAPRALLALKCFATWGVFDFMRDYMDGTTSSSLNEVRLGHTRFGKETHAYSVAYADHEIDEVVSHADKIIFNSIGQLTRFGASRRASSAACGSIPASRPRPSISPTRRGPSRGWANGT